MNVFALWEAYLTQGFKSTHMANDYGWIRLNLSKPPVYSVMKGVVIASYYSSGGGNIVAILDDSGDFHWYQWRYVHLDVRYVKIGDRVDVGQVIGLGGNTGTNSTGPHLHIECLIVPKGYRAFIYADRLKYAVDPRFIMSTIPGQPLRGELIQMSVVDTSLLPKAFPTITNLLLRSSTSTATSLNKVGVYVPASGLPLAGIIDVAGFKWCALWYNNKIVYAALKYLRIEPNVKEVEKIVEVEKPFGPVTLTQGDVSITIKKG